MNFLNIYGSILLFFINLILWYLHWKKNEYRNINNNVTRYFVIFLFLFSIWNLLSILSNIFIKKIGIIVWLSFWSIISIYELYFILKLIILFSEFKSKLNDLLVIVIAILSVPICLASLLTWTYKSYNPINTADFFNITLLMSGSLYIFKKLLNNINFIDNIESFFIVAGFLLYFGLHILASSVLSIDFLKNWNFGQYATITSLIFWLGSLFFIWKIRSKHSF